MRKRFDLRELQAKNLPRVQWTDLLSVNGGDLSESDSAQMVEYFAQFVLVGDNVCPGCGSKLAGDMVSQLLGEATFTWGLAHGEGFCRTCGYPARAYHRDIGPIKFLPLVLPYHPSELEEP